MSASVYRVVKSQDYVTMANHHLRDKRLSMAAKGLMSVFLADEGDAAYTVAELAERGPEGRDAIRTALRALEGAGYIQRRQTHDGGGRFAGNEYLVYESPLTGKPLTENPTTVPPLTEKPLTENPATVDRGAVLELNQGFSNASGEGISVSKSKEEELINPPTNPPEAMRGAAPKWKPERFAAFWQFYRTHFRGESKQAAARAWDKLKPDSELIAVMGRALQRQLKTEEHRRGIGIPYAATWLNQRRWEDDIRLPGVRDERASALIEEEAGVRDWTPEEDE